MSLFQCDKCGCCENTALSFQGFKEYIPEESAFDWRGKEEWKGKKLCCACGPQLFTDGEPTHRGDRWHNRFARVFLPKGKFFTNEEGNLEHKDTGDTDYKKYELDEEEPVYDLSSVFKTAGHSLTVVEAWHVTPSLRWLQRYKPSETNAGVFVAERVLQQLWQSSEGVQEWRDVEVSLEDER